MSTNSCNPFFALDPLPLSKDEMLGIKTEMELSADVARRTIFIYEPITEEVASRFMMAMRRIVTRTREGVTVLLNSPGGSTYDAMAIYDMIRGCPNEVTIVGTGNVMSAAAAILQAGKYRYLTPQTRFMIHDGSWHLGDAHASVVISAGKEQEATNYQYHKILADRSGLPIEKVEMLCLKETYLSAEETIGWGFADALFVAEGPNNIVVPKK